MVIKELEANFGTLHNKKLLLHEGLNIIEAPNESGKSTWSAFIRTMIYGINNAERDRANSLSDKNRYRPWDGGEMSGRMRINCRFGDLTVERISAKNSAFRSLSVYKTDTADEIPELCGNDFGKILLGVSENVFRRSAFINQDKMAVEADSELEQRINSLISSGDERLSYSLSDDRLGQWQRRRYYNQRGDIANTEHEIANLEKTLSEITYYSDLLQSSVLNADSCRAKISELQKKAEILELQTRFDKYTKAHEKLLNCKARLTALESAAVSPAIISEAKKSLALLSEQKLDLKRLEISLQSCEASLNALNEKMQISPFYGQSAEEAFNTAQNAADEYRTLKALKKPSILPEIGLTAILIIITLILYLANIGIIAYIGSAAVIAFSAVCGHFRAQKKMRLITAAERCTKLENEFGAASADDIERSADAFIKMYSETELLETERHNIIAAIKNKKAKILMQESALTSLLSKFEINAQIDQAEDILSRASEQRSKLEIERIRYEQAQEDLDSLGPMPDVPELSHINVSAEDISAEKKALENDLLEFLEKAARAEGSLELLGDPEELYLQKLHLEEQKARLETEYKAISLARKALQEANDELREIFSPQLAKRTGELMSKLTKGRYEHLNFDKNFSSKVKENGDIISHSGLYLSTGATNQMYLALRLALIEMILPKEDPCPIILDDALMSFDDERTACALDVLNNIAQSRQVILFTCHTRESRYIHRSYVEK